MNQQLTWVEATSIVSNKSILITEDREQILASLDFINVPWEAAEIYYNHLSKREKRLIKKSGQQGQMGFWDPKTKTLTKNPTRARAIFLCQIYIGQGGKCAYSHQSCKIDEIQVEHLVPNGGDYPENILILKANVNGKRKNTRLETFVNAIERDISLGEEEYNKKYARGQKKKSDNAIARKSIASMNEDELRAYIESGSLEGNAKHWDYIYRNIGMSSIFKERPNTTSITGKRNGGCQGNYTDVLRTCAMEYLYGDKRLARQIFDNITEAGKKYTNQQIQNDDYIKVMCDNIELSNHINPRYNRDQFTTKRLKNLPRWQNVK
jgi:hypothetical protein